MKSANHDALVKSPKTPSPLMVEDSPRRGEGWGEGEKGFISNAYIPLPLIPSRQGRGNKTFYESINHLIFPFFIVVLSGTVFSFSAPYFPIDETRYLTVAWEMKLHDSFIVPLLNGLPYAHKPPLLFWLINLDWFLFGTNEETLRFIPLLFSLLNIVMVHRISLMLWDDKKIAGYATVILSSTLIYLIWSALIMFDVILTFWVLVGIFGLLSAAKNDKRRSWILVGISIGGGLLTKGPAIFIHILPVSILSFLWMSGDKSDLKKWYVRIMLSIITGIGIALLWVIPAAIMGGDTYKEAILWGQTANRVLSSFAHQKPIWWYIPSLPLIFLPWVIIKPAWSGYSAIKHDKGYRFLVVWILSTIILFSLISGKQIHYLIPLLPAVSLLTAKNIAAFSTKNGKYTKLHYPVAAFYITLGVIMLLLTVIKLGNDAGSIPFNLIRMLTIGFVSLGSIMFFIRPASMDKLIKIIAVSSSTFIIIILLAGADTFFSRYDISNISHIIKEKQEDGYEVINYGKYYGQYQFLGRLTQPLVVLEDKKSLGEYAKTHKKVLLITYEEPGNAVDENEVLYQQLYRGKKVILWRQEGIHHFLKL